MYSTGVMTSYRYCICTTVDGKALQALLEASGRGTYKDGHPWLVARDFLRRANEEGMQLAILFATGAPHAFSHWGHIENIDVHQLHRGQWETRCRFTPLQPINPIWTSVDSVFLKPSDEQLQRESLEGIHQHRYPLTERELHPYAICETPAFLLREDAENV